MATRARYCNSYGKTVALLCVPDLGFTSAGQPAGNDQLFVKLEPDGVVGVDDRTGKPDALSVKDFLTGHIKFCGVGHVGIDGGQQLRETHPASAGLAQGACWRPEGVEPHRRAQIQPASENWRPPK